MGSHTTINIIMLIIIIFILLYLLNNLKKMFNFTIFVFARVKHFILPFYKYPSLHCMDNAPKSWLLLRTTPRHTHPPAEGTRQPVTHLTGHRLCLQVAELILSVQKTPSRQTETSVSKSSDRRGQRCIQLLMNFTVVCLLRPTWSHLCKQRPAWQQPALCSCGVPSCPQPLGPSAQGPSSV